METLNITEVCEFLTSHDNFLLLTHAQPDGDTIGSAYGLGLALQMLGKKVKVKCSDAIPAKFTFISNSLKQDECIEQTIVALDVADPKLLGKLRGEYADKVDLCIDHHISNKSYAKRLFLDGQASATCEIVYEIINQLGCEMNRHIMEALYTGIITDTGCFKYSNCTAKTHIIAAELIKMGVDYAELNRIMFDTKSKPRMRIEAAVGKNMEFFFGGRVAFVAITKKMVEETGADESDLDGINAISRTIEGVMVGVTLREKEEGIKKISVRTNNPIDATGICTKFGGGGHARAAGCEFCCTVDEVKEQLMPAIKEALEEQGCLI